MKKEVKRKRKTVRYWAWRLYSFAVDWLYLLIPLRWISNCFTLLFWQVPRYTLIFIPCCSPPWSTHKTVTLYAHKSQKQPCSLTLCPTSDISKSCSLNVENIDIKYGAFHDLQCYPSWVSSIVHLVSLSVDLPPAVNLPHNQLFTF